MSLEVRAVIEAVLTAEDLKRNRHESGDSNLATHEFNEGIVEEDTNKKRVAKVGGLYSMNCLLV